LEEQISFLGSRDGRQKNTNLSLAGAGRQKLLHLSHMSLSPTQDLLPDLTKLLHSHHPHRHPGSLVDTRHPSRPTSHSPIRRLTRSLPWSFSWSLATRRLPQLLPSTPVDASLPSCSLPRSLMPFDRLVVDDRHCLPGIIMPPVSPHAAASPLTLSGTWILLHMPLYGSISCSSHRLLSPAEVFSDLPVVDEWSLVYLLTSSLLWPLLIR
jgi:hypothetical protein